MLKKTLTIGLLGFITWWIYRQYQNYEIENYIVSVEDTPLSKAVGFVKASFDSAISYGQEDLGMNFSIQLLDYLKLWERYEGKAYRDAVGILTIGYGHRIYKGDTYRKDANTNILLDENAYLTTTDALGLLLQDIEERGQRKVKQYVKIPLSQNQFDALVSFTFNGGDISQVSKTVNSGGDVTARMSLYIKGGKPLKIIQGLVNRRAADNRIWNDAVYKK